MCKPQLRGSRPASRVELRSAAPLRPWCQARAWPAGRWRASRGQARQSPAALLRDPGHARRRRHAGSRGREARRLDAATQRPAGRGGSSVAASPLPFSSSAARRPSRRGARGGAAARGGPAERPAAQRLGVVARRAAQRGGRWRAPLCHIRRFTGSIAHPIVAVGSSCLVLARTVTFTEESALPFPGPGRAPVGQRQRGAGRCEEVWWTAG